MLPRSLGSALSQTYQDIEVVVCDDGSMDETKTFLDSQHDERLRIVAYPSNRGMLANMNCCLEQASGDYFLMLSDDDFLEPTCVECLLAPWDEYVGLSMVYGQWWYHMSDSTELQVSEGPDVEDGINYVLGYWQGRRPTILHGILFRTHDIRRVGGIPAGYAHDTMLTLRLALEGRVAHVRKPVTNYVLHSGSRTHGIRLSISIHDMDSMLEMCLRVGREKGISGHLLSTMQESVGRRLSRVAALGIVSLVGSGSPRLEALREAYALRAYLSRSPLVSLPSLFLAACMPRGIINFMRYARRHIFKGLNRRPRLIGDSRK